MKLKKNFTELLDWGIKMNKTNPVKEFFKKHKKEYGIHPTKIQPPMPKRIADRIKPCPFCGSKDVDVASIGGAQSIYQVWVYCKNCNAEGPDKSNLSSDSKKEAIAAWNRRVNND